MSHALKYNGAPYTDGATLVHTDTNVTSGAGHALCACGALSPELATGKARRTWFKDHKAQATAPEDEVAEALAELVEPAVHAPKSTPAKIAKARKAKEAPVADGAADEPNAHHQTISFTKAITPGFWRSLGRTATQRMVDELYPTVIVTANNNSRKLTFQGPKEDVAAAVHATKEMWAEAQLAAAEWKKTDEGFLGRATEPLARRREGYHLTERFFEGFGLTYADWTRTR